MRLPPVALTNGDLWAIACQVEEDYGTCAGFFAAERVEHFLEESDLSAAEMWSGIADRVTLLIAAGVSDRLQ
jgi:hypothetical protein